MHSTDGDRAGSARDPTCRRALRESRRCPPEARWMATAAPLRLTAGGGRSAERQPGRCSGRGQGETCAPAVVTMRGRHVFALPRPPRCHCAANCGRPAAVGALVHRSRFHVSLRSQSHVATVPLARACRLPTRSCTPVAVSRCRACATKCASPVPPRRPVICAASNGVGPGPTWSER